MIPQLCDVALWLFVSSAERTLKHSSEQRHYSVWATVPHEAFTQRLRAHLPVPHVPFLWSWINASSAEWPTARGPGRRLYFSLKHGAKKKKSVSFNTNFPPRTASVEPRYHFTKWQVARRHRWYQGEIYYCSVNPLEIFHLIFKGGGGGTRDG